MNGNVGTTWAASATTLEERCMAATAMPDALRQYRASHAEDILSATVEWKNRRNPLRDEDYQGIADALGDDASVVETVIADRERKLSGHVEPAWSVELQTILNRYDSEEERVERTGYATAFAPFVAYVKAELQAYMSACSLPMNDERLIEQCLSAYVERLLGIGLKTVVWELHVARQAGSLGDGDAKRQLRRYFELLATDEYRGHMYAKYPVLLRFVTQTTVHYIDFVKEMLDRVSMDRDELASFAGVGDDFRLEDMSIDRGDAHDGGRAVAMLTIGGRKIVYKPRDLHIHELFAGLVRRCERTKGFLPMRVSDVLTKSGYAYEEFVEHGTCEDARQVERYYTRYGQLLGLVWLLHGDDMHHENIIASGEYPMVVDFETIATNHVTMDMPDGTGADIRVSTILRDSLASSCLLPAKTAMSADGTSVDISAFETGEQTMPGIVASPVGLDSADAHYERNAVTFSKDGCAVTLDDAVVDPYHYERQILQGFRNTVAAAMTIDADEWDAMLSGEDTTVRVLVRNTSAYARFADFIHHPSALKDMLDVEAILENLYVYPFRDKRIFASEYRQMLAGDIPMFTAQLTGHDLHAPDGTTIDGVCERSVRERVLDTIGHLDEQAALQSRIIRNALRMEPGMEDAHPTASVSSDTDAEHYPIELGTRIADTAILQETDGTVSWLTANRSDTMAADKTVDERYEPGAPTSGLYDGMAGTGMFAAELYRRTHDERWRDLCTRMMRSLMRRKDRGITYSGFTSGLSRSYCALRMANAGITSPEARRCMTQTVRMLPAYIDDMLPKLLQRDNPQPSFHLDYLTGAGSSIMLYLRLYDVFHDMRIVEQTSRLGRTVIRAFPETQRNADESDDMPYPTGAAHGLEGMAVAFWKLYAATGNREFAEFARMLWRKSDARRSGAKQEDAGKWCRGKVGVLWARNELAATAGADGERFFEDESGRAFPDKADITALLGNADWDDDGVCHGRCGMIDTLISIGNANGDEWYRMQAQRLMDDMIAQARSSGRFRLRQSREFVDLSYFQGPVGVAYTMLRLNDPSTPSILALETR